jgi:hypothetical protein
MTPAQFAKLVEQRERAESDLRRTFHRWEKICKQQRRAERFLDSEFSRRAAGDIPGKVDARRLMK